jgi:hypothetical protein
VVAGEGWEEGFDRGWGKVGVWVGIWMERGIALWWIVWNIAVVVVRKIFYALLGY